jgi:hypothetical protein
MAAPERARKYAGWQRAVAAVLQVAKDQPQGTAS